MGCSFLILTGGKADQDMDEFILKAKAEQVAYFSPFRGHIHNPGMGIISMAISDHMVTGYTQADRDKADMQKPFDLTPKMLEDVAKLGYIDNFYIRVGWNDVQKEKGKLSLSPEFEMALDAVKKYGLSWGLRIMQSSPSNPTEHTVPEFLADQLEMFPYYGGATYGPLPRKFPLYTEDYLKYWNEMLLMLGEKFDSDPALEYADVSGFGLWGEGHHGTAVTPGGPLVDVNVGSEEHVQSVVARLLEGHRKAFLHTPMVVNLAMSEYDAVQKAVADGAWVRRDSYYGWFTASQAYTGLNRRGDAAMIFETVMPGILCEDSDDPAFRRSYMETPDKMCDYGAAYGIIGFNPLDTLYADHMLPQLFDAFKNRLGYRLRPSVVWKISDDSRLSLALGIVNDGAAAPPGTVIFTAKTAGSVNTVKVNGEKLTKGMMMVEIPIDDAACEEVVLTMELVLGDKHLPARFAADVRQPEAPRELHIRMQH